MHRSIARLRSFGLRVLAVSLLLTRLGLAAPLGDAAAVAVPAAAPPDLPADPAPAPPAPASYEPDAEINPAYFQEPPAVRPAEPIRPEAPAPAATAQVSGLFGPSEATRALLTEERRSRASAPSTEVVSGAESSVRATSDAGDLVGKSPSGLGVEVQKRTPIVTDPRSRGTRTGQLLAAGSYWIPARQDLDTMLSKIDSSIVDNMLVIKGPYSARYGPGFAFFDIQLLDAPRYADGPEWHGRTSLNYETNGGQWYGRQSFMAGSTDWGMRVGYGHRTGNDYESGDGTDIPSSYNSRDFDTALGFDLSPDSHLELSYLRLDQTGVEFPGQIFDIDFLVTDAYGVRYVLENQPLFDRFTFDTWYNRTKFEGNAQRAGKRRQIPELNQIEFTGFTDVDAMSTGYRADLTWGAPGCPQLTFGSDLRYVKQELNEFDQFQFTIGNIVVPVNANFPIPRSHESNPGVFLEQTLPLCDDLVVRAGARVDWVSTNIEGTPPGRTRQELHQILESDDFDREFNLWSAYVTAEDKLDCHWTALTGFGYAMRPPTLTELYATDPFLAILQQGFSSVRGNPDLNAERLWQLDLGLKADYGCFRGGVSGFYAWVHDFITYEAIGQPITVPDALVVRFLNTNFATLSGGEMFGEYDLNAWLTPFATFAYVEGRDHSRDDRGRLPTIHGSSEEPLPGIAPLESHLGVRLHEPCPNPRWGVELMARVVDNQDRVATSLLERETPGFTVWNLRSYWHATDSLTLVAGVENFTDKNYREHLDLRTGTGVFQPGVNGYFGVELTY